MFKFSKETLENIKIVLGIICIYLFSIYYLFFMYKPRVNSYSYYGRKQSMTELIMLIIFIIITGIIIFTIYYWIRKILKNNISNRRR